MVKIDIVCPVCEKDFLRFEILNLSLKAYLKLQANCFLIIKRDCFSLFERYSSFWKIIFEDELIPNVNWDNYGWIKQQLLKIKSCKISRADYLLILDADCILNKKLSYNSLIFNDKGKIWFGDESFYSWYLGSSKLLSCQIPPNRIQVTPCLLSTKILNELNNKLSQIPDVYTKMYNMSEKE